MSSSRLVVRLLAGALALGGSVAHAACTVEAINPEQKDITCSLDDGTGARRFRFDTTLLGGHDDTRASLRVTVDGRAYDCATGSKTSLFGEDGEVHLFCNVKGPGRVLKVSVVFTHAQYGGFALTAE